MNIETRIMSASHSRLVGLMTLFLAAVGFILVSSASMDVAARTYDNEFYFAIRHLLFIGMAVLAGVLCFQVPLEIWQRRSVWLLMFAFLLLILVLLPGVGRTVNGSTRWIPLGIFNMQVSEVAKMGVICYISGYLVRRSDEVRSTFWGFLKPFLLMFLMSALLLMQPDFGATVVIMSTVFVMMFLAGVRYYHYLTVLVGGVTAAVLVILSSEYRMKRMLAYVDPWADQYSTGYQLVQSLIAFGRGDVFGVGLGNSVQKLFYLPEAHTDFVFAVLAEEFGLMGCAMVLAAFVVLVISGLFIGRRAERMGQHFGAYVAYGVSVMIGMQSMVNIGVASGLLPTKGLTLPLISYGGSSMIMSGIALALLLRVDFEMRYILATDSAMRRKLAAEENRNNEQD
jgi:cell division protein FtsW